MTPRRRKIDAPATGFAPLRHFINRKVTQAMPPRRPYELTQPDSAEAFEGRCRVTGRKRVEWALSGPQQMKVVAAGVDAAIEAWDCGSPDDAVEKLTAAAESGILVGSKLPVFMLSETDVAEMSRMQRNQFVTDLIKRMESLKPIGQSCLSAGNALLGDGDVDGARDHYNAVARLGAEALIPWASDRSA